MQQEWRPRPGDRVVRHPREEEIGPLRIVAATPRVPPRNFGSLSLLVGGFSALIGVGTLLLLLPFTNNHGGMTPLMDAFFTAASAVTVTGLVVVDTPTYWSFAGQFIIMVLIFTGGLGIITIATFLLIMTGQRVTLMNRLLMKENLGVDQLGGLIILTRRVVFVVGALQLVGFLLLSARLLGDYPLATVLFQSAFHTVAAFNNAGFTILPDSQSLNALRLDLWFLIPIMYLIIAGGLGYSVLQDLLRNRRFNRFTLDTKLVVTLSMVLWGIGALVILVSEYSNPATFGPMSLGAKVLNSVFYSVSTRTAGFDTVDFGGMKQHTGFFITVLMFIGAASASTAGGIKVNTVAVLLAAAISSIGGKTHVTAFGREIPHFQVYRALTMFILGMAVVFSLAFFLTLSEGFPFIQTLFETVSAFGTVGLSLGITPELSTQGRLIIVLTMFLGRVGPLGLALVLAEREKAAPYRYAEERVKIG
ncbi:MAG: potassium uptake protein, TrkH family [Dehalococcoidia bacterium]|nr:potassium uptake protein, TrkH family [Dehalococcoidia bacterium]